MDLVKNPLKAGADPYVLYRAPYYYALDTGCSYEEGQNGAYMVLRRHKQLSKVFTEGEKHNIYLPKATHFPQAPEIHFYNGKFYILYSLAFFDGATVLESVTDDAFGEYTVKTQSLAQGLVPDLQTYDHTMYCASDGSLWGCAACFELMVIYKLKDPYTLDGDVLPFVYADRPRENGLVEAPFFLERDGVISIMFSSGRYQDDTYCVGLLTFDGKVGDDLRDASLWHKREGQLFEQYGEVTGPGHNSVVQSPDGTQYWNVYHAHDGKGNEERYIFMQPMSWENSLPVLGRPYAVDTEIPLPSGETEVKQR